MNCFFAHKKLKKPPQKVAYLWQLGGFFLFSPDCPKQLRTSFSFYKLFYPIVSAKVSDDKRPSRFYYACFERKKNPAWSIIWQFDYYFPSLKEKVPAKSFQLSNKKAQLCHLYLTDSGLLRRAMSQIAWRVRVFW